MKKDYDNILVVGLGFRSGLTVANFLAGKGYGVVVSDMKTEEELKPVLEKLDSSVEKILGHQDVSVLEKGFDLIVLSPGVPKRIPLVATAIERGIEVISEVELAYRFMEGSVISITGTDGKSTTTALTGEIFKRLGFETFVGGNIGIPLTSLAEKTGPESVTVVELSSFQLETLDTYRSDVSAILNIAPDHLDRYSGMEEYFNAKKNIYKNMTDSDVFVYNLDNIMLVNASNEFPENSISFSMENESAEAFYRDGIVYLNEIAVLECSKMKMLGLHNVQNAMAAILMTVSLLNKKGITPDYDAIAEACYGFRGLEHRFEVLGDYNGVTVINDSKATTVGAVETAIGSITDKGVVIIGGRTKGDNYSRLIPLMKEKVRALVLIGESTDEFSITFRNLDTVKAGDIDNALVKAIERAQEGDMVILSPACASFDMFESYEDRGDKFREAFEKIKRGDLS